MHALFLIESYMNQVIKHGHSLSGIRMLYICMISSTSANLQAKPPLALKQLCCRRPLFLDDEAQLDLETSLVFEY
jgi:hypothetical protein